MHASRCRSRPASPGHAHPHPLGIIPDGNRRWAQARGLPKSAGYEHGIEPGKQLFDVVWDLGIKEVSTYIFTKENTHRPKDQVEAFKAALLKFIDWVENQDASVLLVGDTGSTVFPEELKHLAVPEEGRDRETAPQPPRQLQLEVGRGRGDPGAGERAGTGGDPLDLIGSRHVSRIDLVIRWGGRSRLSGFLPLQSAYADLYVVDACGPTSRWDTSTRRCAGTSGQDVTMGG